MNKRLTRFGKSGRGIVWIEELRFLHEGMVKRFLESEEFLLKL